MRILFAFLLALIFISLNEAKVSKGQFKQLNDDWHYLDKFCFDTSGKGTLQWTIYSDKPEVPLLMLFYDDVDSSWPRIYPNRGSMSCEIKALNATGSRIITVGIPQTEYFIDLVRPHYWYFVISNCNGPSVNLDYSIQMLQAESGWNQQFSFDEEGMAQSFLIFWLFFSFLVALEAYGIWKLVKILSFHPILRLLTAIFALEWLYIFCSMIHYLAYKDNGVGAPGLKGLGEVLDFAAQTLFVFLILLFAKGWTITNNELTGKKIFIGVLALFLLLYIILFIWQNVGQDPASTLYVYETIPGILILVLRGLTALLFIWWLRSTLFVELDPSKKRFYYIFAAFSLLWFFMLIFIVILAAILPAWTRFKIVTEFYLIDNFLALCFLGFILWPSRAQNYFQLGKTGLLLEGSSNSPYERL